MNGLPPEHRTSDRSRLHASTWRSLSTALAMATGSGVDSLYQLAAIPLLLSAWGPETYADWLILTTIPTLILTSNIGLFSTAATDLIHHQARQDEAGFRETFQSACVLLAIVTFGLVALAGLSAAWGIARTGGFRALEESELRWLVAILLGQVTVTHGLRLLQVIFRGSLQAAAGVMWGNLQRFTVTLLTLVLASCGGDPVEVAGTCLAGQAVVLTAMAIDLRKKGLSCPFGWTAVRRNTLTRLIVTTLGGSAIPASQALRLQGGIWVVKWILGAEAVPAFHAIRMLTRVALEPTRILAEALRPELSAAFAQADSRACLRLTVRGIAWTCLANLAMSLVVALAGSPFFRLWTSGRLEYSAPLLLAFLASGVLQSLWGATMMVPLAVNQHGRLSGWLTAFTVASLLLAGPATWLAGAPGVPGAFLVGDAIFLVLSLGSAANLLARPPQDIVRLSRFTAVRALTAIGRNPWGALRSLRSRGISSC